MAATLMAEPPTGPNWLFELKYDGFRALAYVSDQVALVSRKNHTDRRFDRLAKEIGLTLSPHEAVLDGEIICVDVEGRPQFYDLLRTRKQAIYAAFDLLWLDGDDVSKRPLVQRKPRLQKLVPKNHHALPIRAAFRLARREDLQAGTRHGFGGHRGQAKNRALWRKQLGKDPESQLFSKAGPGGVV
jgi:bifunctional non-homologous end joining protein LigD